MPVSCENSETAISSALSSSLQQHGSYNNSNSSVTKANNLGLTKNQLSASLKQSLLKPIEYVESPPGFGYSIQDTLRAKYTVLRPLDEEKTTAQSVGGKLMLMSYSAITKTQSIVLLFHFYVYGRSY